MTMEPTIHAVNRGSGLFFPPFPPKPPSLIPFDQFEQPGIWIGSSKNTIDSFGQATAAEVDPAELAAQAHERKLRQLQKGKLCVRVLREDCWRLGDDPSWREPEGTSRSDYDPSIPPFTRLVSAARDFLLSRHEEFQFNRSKRLMDSIRNAFGLRTEFRGPHVNGSGENGSQYQPPRISRDRYYQAGQDTIATMTPENEACVLLTRPVAAVRGFLALARRDAEAGWDTAPALKLTKITAAFLSFIEHYNVIEELQTELAEAARIARAAHDLVVSSKAFEDSLCDGHGLNRAVWTVYGGEWGGPERGGLEKEGEMNVPAPLADDESDGGWEVDIVYDNRPEPISVDKAKNALQPILPSSLKMTGYIPFARRQVSALHPPSADARFKGLYRIDTIKAPWTADEGWRRLVPDDDGDMDDGDDASSITTTTDSLEKEKATIDEPDALSIWCDLSGMDKPQDVVGCGLRGRWALFEPEDGLEAFWVFKAKDYILPAFWQRPTTA